MSKHTPDSDPKQQLDISPAATIHRLSQNTLFVADLVVALKSIKTLARALEIQNVHSIPDDKKRSIFTLTLRQIVDIVDESLDEGGAE